MEDYFKKRIARFHSFHLRLGGVIKGSQNQLMHLLWSTFDTFRKKDNSSDHLSHQSSASETVHIMAMVGKKM